MSHTKIRQRKIIITVSSNHWTQELKDIVESDVAEVLEEENITVHNVWVED